MTCSLWGQGCKTVCVTNSSCSATPTRHPVTFVVIIGLPRLRRRLSGGGEEGCLGRWVVIDLLRSWRPHTTKNTHDLSNQGLISLQRGWRQACATSDKLGATKPRAGQIHSHIIQLEEYMGEMRKTPTSKKTETFNFSSWLAENLCNVFEGWSIFCTVEWNVIYKLASWGPSLNGRWMCTGQESNPGRLPDIRINYPITPTIIDLFTQNILSSFGK